MSTARGRFVLGAVVALLLFVIVVVVGVMSGWIGSSPVTHAVAPTPTPSPPTTATPTTSPSPTRIGTTSPTPPAAPTVKVPHTNDADAYASAIATLAFSYDTTVESRDAWRAVLMAELAPDGHFDTLAQAQGDVDRVVPTADTWTQMSRLHQRSTFTATAAYTPQAAIDARDQYGNQWPPGISIVTVTGKQHLIWDGGKQDVDRAMTFEILCQPSNPRCMVDRITPQVAK